jgi:hypothetical protein
MAKPRAFRIVATDQLSLDQFRRWHDIMISLAQPGASGDHVLPQYGFKFALRATDCPVPDCDLSWGIDAAGRTVQINPATSAGDANVLAAIGEDREAPGRYAVLRQGRLHPNRETSKQVSGGEFRYAFQRSPVSTSGSFGARGREWYLVCDLSDDADEVARQTADFVERCAQVRAQHATAKV